MKIGTALLVGLLPVASLYAQRGDPHAVELANLREDVRLLQQTVAELRGTVEQLQRENAALTRQNESGRANYATPAQLSAAVAQVEQTTAAALADQKRDLLQTVAQQIAKLVKETNAALAAISKSQPSRPAATMQFSDDFPKEGLTHTVRPGETLSMIARKYNVSMRNIQNANRLADPTRIHAGQNLFIPGAASAATSAPPVRHTN